MSQIPSLSAITPLPVGETRSVRESGLQPQSVPDGIRQQEQLAGQFEGMFVSMLLKEMRSTLEGGLFGAENSDTYGALFDMYLGQHLADSNALGIRKLLLNQWQAPERGKTLLASEDTDGPGQRQPARPDL